MVYFSAMSRAQLIDPPCAISVDLDRLSLLCVWLGATQFSFVFKKDTNIDKSDGKNYLLLLL